jgi:hypothetical protein
MSFRWMCEECKEFGTSILSEMEQIGKFLPIDYTVSYIIATKGRQQATVCVAVTRHPTHWNKNETCSRGHPSESHRMKQNPPKNDVKYSVQ